MFESPCIILKTQIYTIANCQMVVLFDFYKNIWLKHICNLVQSLVSILDSFSFQPLNSSRALHMDLNFFVLFRLFVALNICHINSGYVLDARKCCVACCCENTISNLFFFIANHFQLTHIHRAQFI